MARYSPGSPGGAGVGPSRREAGTLSESSPLRRTTRHFTNGDRRSTGIDAPAEESSTAKNFDAIVIGAGHNGLVAAAYLARSGLQVLVLERRHLVGGACVTEEVVPGFRFSRAAYVNSLFRPQIIRDLRLREHGFRMLPRNPSSFTPLTDGRHLFLGPDAGLNQREIARFSSRDAARFPRYEDRLDRLARFMEPLLDEGPPDTAPSGTWARLASAAHMGRLGLRALRLGRDLPALLEIMTAPATRILDRWFESEALRATLATDAIIGAMVSPSTPGSGYVLFHHVMGETDGARGVWGYVRGGMGALSEAIRRSAASHGATVLTERSVARILLEGECAAGVVLEDGTEIRARAVLSGVDPKRTFLGMVPEERLPEDFRRHIESLDMSSGATKINVAVDRLPAFAALPRHSAADGNAGAERDSTPGPEHRGTIHFSQSIDEIEKAYREAASGQASSRPVIEMTIPSALDDSLAPPGQHVVSLFVQYTPYSLSDGSWDDPGRKEAFADRVFEVIEEFAPGFTASVVGRDILSPVDLEREFGMTGGNIFHGAMSLDQLFWLRPAPGWSRYRTPVPALYLCGSGAHPGGGVLGAPGRNAAYAVLADLKRGRR